MIIDIHRHLLPDLDDGAATWEETLLMAEIAVSEGVTETVCTPHYWVNESAFDLIQLEEKVKEAQKRLDNQGIPLLLHSGVEVFFTPALLSLAEEKKLPPFAGENKYLLVEFARDFVPEQAGMVFFQMIARGVTPIIAHPERNRYLAQRVELLQEFVRMGALCQVTTGSITGLFGNTVAKNADRMLKVGLIHLVASDAHTSGRRSPRFQEARQVLEKRCSKDEVEALFYHNPCRIIRGEPIESHMETNDTKKNTRFLRWIKG